MPPQRPSPDEGSFASRLQAGDRAAFDRFYEVTFRRVFTYALHHTEDRVTAEWVTEATLTEAMERLGELRGREVPPSWLLGILVAKLAIACDPPEVVQLPPRRWRGRLGHAWSRLVRARRRRVGEEALR